MKPTYYGHGLSIGSETNAGVSNMRVSPTSSSRTSTTWAAPRPPSAP
ncbi:MAG: hypothetical protein ACOC9U_06380 [bacterium]